MDSPIPDLAGTGPYKPTWDSLLQYEAPEWYQDAKFGIWAHWSPQCVPEVGDWYARNMYVEGSRQNKYHLEHYGPPSRFGYKDLCAQWTLLNWEPDELIARYKKAGARIFIALANHHDSFDTWDSKHQPWNAAAMGPHRDVSGNLGHRGAEAGTTLRRHSASGVQLVVFPAFARSGQIRSAGWRSLRWGFIWRSRSKTQWWQGLDPHSHVRRRSIRSTLCRDASYVKNFYDRTRDLIDQHDPDLLYFDNDRCCRWAGAA